MSRRPKVGREALQRLPDGPDSAKKATIKRDGITARREPTKRQKVIVTVRPAKSGAPITLSGRPASVVRLMMRRGWVSVLDLAGGWRLPWSVSLIAAAGLDVSREWFFRGDQRLKRYRLADCWKEEPGHADEL